MKKINMEIQRKNKSHKAVKSKLKISKNMTFAELMEKHPEAAGELFKQGMHCIGCGAAAFETIEQGALMHGIDVDDLIKKLNNEKTKSKKKK
jgi:hybrid cluster-associated redox disulfide protein